MVTFFDAVRPSAAVGAVGPGDKVQSELEQLETDFVFIRNGAAKLHCSSAAGRQAGPAGGCLSVSVSGAEQLLKRGDGGGTSWTGQVKGRTRMEGRNIGAKRTNNFK